MSGRAPLLLLFAAAALCAVGAQARARVWGDRGRLWRDATDKLFLDRILDAAGAESPRPGHGRPYNNIGLHLYDQGRELLHLRLAAAGAAAPGARRDPEAEALLVKRLDRVAKRLVDAIPTEFVPACTAAGVRADRQDWEAFLPAELCLRRALFHHPDYAPAHLNLGLVEKLRAFVALDPRIRAERLRNAADRFATVTALDPASVPAWRYRAEALEPLGEWREADDAARIAIGLAGPGRTADLLALRARCLIARGDFEAGAALFATEYRAAETQPRERARNALRCAALLRATPERATAFFTEARLALGLAETDPLWQRILAETQ